MYFQRKVERSLETKCFLQNWIQGKCIHFVNFAGISISNHRFRVQIGINLHKWVFQKAGIALAALASAISAFLKTHKCKLISNWTRKTVWLLINNINMKKFAWRKCQKIFLEAIFFSFEKTFLKVSTQNFRHHFMWYHWLKKFPTVFQPIIIQNYDV